MEGVLEATFQDGRREVCFSRIVGSDFILQVVGRRLEKTLLSLIRARLEDVKVCRMNDLLFFGRVTLKPEGRNAVCARHVRDASDVSCSNGV
jgi:hypothetical protein